MALLAIAVASAIVSDAKSAERPARILLFKPGVGAGLTSAGLLVADIDADGEAEIVTGGGSASTGPALYWAVFERDPCCPETPVFYQARASIPTGDFSYSFASAQVDNDPQLELVVPETNEVLIYDSDSTRVEHRFSHPLGFVRAIAVADLDHDGTLEAIMSGEEASAIVSLPSGRIETLFEDMASDSIVVGEMDGDPGLEVAFLGGTSVDDFVVDGSSGSVEWVKRGGLGFRGRAADVDGDGLDELFVVRSSPRPGVASFDIDTRRLKYEIPTATGPWGLALGDLEGDGEVELVVSRVGSFRIHRGLDGQFVDDFASSYRAVDVFLYDFNDDGVAEIVLLDGFGQSGSDTYVSIVELDGTPVWSSDNYRGPFFGAALEDLDGDQNRELVLLPSSSRGERSPGRVQVFDFATGVREYSAPMPPGVNRVSQRLEATDLDHDGLADLVIAENPGRINGVAAYSGLTHAQLWRYTTTSLEEHFCGMALGNLDDDPGLEIALSTRNGSGSPHVVVLDGETGVPEWLSPGLPVSNSNVCSLRLGQLDGDESLEIAAGAAGAQLVVLSPDEGTIDLVTSDLDLSALEVVDWDLDGRAEVLVGDSEGRVFLVDPRSGVLVAQVADLGERIGSITKLPSGFASPSLVVGSGHSLYLLDGATGRIGPLLNLPFGEIGGGDSVQLLGRSARRGRYLLSVSGGSFGLGHVGVVVVDIPGHLPNVPASRDRRPTNR
ncbi:MAG: hypothetical protein R2991_08570 [Thermoanaerobaculia bacterium]